MHKTELKGLRTKRMEQKMQEMEKEMTEEILYPFLVFKAAIICIVWAVSMFRQSCRCRNQFLRLSVLFEPGWTGEHGGSEKTDEKENTVGIPGFLCDDGGKKKYIEWVETLEHIDGSGEKFTLAMDPCQCKLGKWYCSFKSDNQEAIFHPHKIEDPRARLHKAALDVENCL